MTLSPRLKTPADHIEEPRFVRRRFLQCRAAVEAGAERRVPADVVPAPHLILKKAGEEQTLRSGDFHHQPVLQQRRVEYKMIEDRAESCRSGHLLIGFGGDERVVRQHAGVVQQLLAIDCRPGDVLKASKEKFQRLPIVRCEEFS